MAADLRRYANASIQKRDYVMQPWPCPPFALPLHTCFVSSIWCLDFGEKKRFTAAH
jgi:hypothetical protein